MDWFEAARDAVWNYIFKPILDAFGWIIDQIKNMIASFFTGIISVITSAFSAIGQLLYSAVTAPINLLIVAWNSVGEFIAAIPPYAKPIVPLIIVAVVAIAAYIVWYVIKSVLPLI